MIALLLFLAIPAFSQTIAGPESATSSTDQNTIDTLTQQVACISSGNCQLTGTPNFQNGIQINGVQLSTAAALTGVLTSTFTNLSLTGNSDFRISSHDVAGVFNDTITASDFPAGMPVYASSGSFSLRYRIQNVSGAAAFFSMHFGTGAANGTCDLGQHYQASDTVPGNVVTQSRNTDVGIQLHGTNNNTQGVISNAVNANATASGEIDFYQVYGSTIAAQAFGHGVHDSADTGLYLSTFGGEWLGAKAITQICIIGSAASVYNATISRDKKFNAHLELWYKGTHQ